MHCERCDVQWSRTHAGETCDMCGAEGVPGDLPETPRAKAAFVSAGARWRPVDAERAS